jgi:hypothetical protein
MTMSLRCPIVAQRLLTFCHRRMAVTWNRTRLGNGEILRMAPRTDLTQAKQFMQSLDEFWQAEYIVRDRTWGKDVTLEVNSEPDSTTALNP